MWAVTEVLQLETPVLKGIVFFFCFLFAYEVIHVFPIVFCAVRDVNKFDFRHVIKGRIYMNERGI